MTALADARRELARAIGVVADEYRRGGRAVDVNGPGWRTREAEVDAAIAAGDVGRARAALAAWLRFALGELRAGSLEEASRDG